MFNTENIAQGIFLALIPALHVVQQNSTARFPHNFGYCYIHRTPCMVGRNSKTGATGASGEIGANCGKKCKMHKLARERRCQMAGEKFIKCAWGEKIPQLKIEVLTEEKLLSENLEVPTEEKLPNRQIPYLSVLNIWMNKSLLQHPRRAKSKFSSGI